MSSAIIVAAGSSRRMGFDKLFAPVHGIPVIALTLVQFARCPAIKEIVLVTQPAKRADFAELVKRYEIQTPVVYADGGEERQNSVFNGVAASHPDSEYVLIHDGARPFATPEIILKTLEAARPTGASVAASKIVDTLKESAGDGTIERTVDRTRMWAVQTPQVFRRELLQRGYEEVFRRGLVVTDDTAAVEFLGIRTMLVDTGRLNIKITTPDDFEIAKILVEKHHRDLIGK